MFDGVNREQTVHIFEETGCEVRSFADGEILLSPASGEKKVGLILEGSAVVKTPDPSKTALLRFLRAGDLCGIANLFTEEPFVSVIYAEKSCCVFFMTEAAVRRLLETDHAFLYRYLSFLSGRVCYLNRKIGYLTAGSAERRLALYLASLKSTEIRLQDSIASLSELLDVGRASLYRAFDRLIADGFIEKSGRRITVLNSVAMLKAYQ